MSNQIADFNSLNALFKVRYADKLKWAIPEMAIIMSKLPFVQGEKQGNTYIQPVILTMDHGFTCHGSNDNILGLNQPVVHESQQASVLSTVYSGRSFISYTVLSRAAVSEQSFINNTSHHVESLTKSFAHMVEAEHWYGQAGLGTSTAATALLNSKKLGLTAENSAAFLWLGGEGMPVDLYVSGAFVLSTSVTAVLIGSSDGGTTEDGGITLTLADVTGISNGNVVTIYRKGYKGNEHAGIYSILTTDNIFNIDGARYGLWKANRHSAASGPLSYSVLSSAVARSIGRGLTGPLMGVVNPKAFRQLLPDYVSLGDINYGSSSTDTQKSNSKARKVGAEPTLVHGVKAIKFICDSIEVEIESSEFVKGSHGFFLDKEFIFRVGSTGVTFNGPGLQGTDQYFIPRPDALSCELRCYCDEAIFTDALNKQLIIQNIDV